MAVRIGNDRTTTPLRVFGRRHNCARISSQCCNTGVERRNSKPNASPERGWTIRGEWVKLEDATGKLGRKMLRAAAVSVLSELQSNLRIERHRSWNIRRPQHYHVESYVVHDKAATAEKFITANVLCSIHMVNRSCEINDERRPMLWFDPISEMLLARILSHLTARSQNSADGPNHKLSSGDTLSVYRVISCAST